MLLQARWVLPISSPPIENGAVLIQDGRIVAVDKAEAFAGRPQILKNATLLPGLVNAHCHLEFSGLKGKMAPGKSFTEWVREMGRVGATRRDAPTDGIDRLLQTGTTTVADHCSPETDFFETPFRRIVFWEVLGAAQDRTQSSLRRAEEQVKAHGGATTPHSVYAVHNAVLANLPWRSVHFLESEDEERFFRERSGPLADYVRERGGDVGLTPKSLPHMIIHGNYLNPSEIAALRGLNASVIHCPGSHRFFGHKPFPYEALRKAGIRVALGTDSLASNEDLSMLREMRLFRESYPEVTTEEILRMATLEGAKALGLESEIGSIEAGKKADLVAVRGQNILEAESVIFSMIDGKVLVNDV